MTSSLSALTDDEALLEKVRRLLVPDGGRRFWMLFLDSRGEIVSTLVPVDGIPDEPDPHDDAKLAPMIEWLAEGAAARSLVFVLERPGGSSFDAADLSWARTLRRAAGLALVDVRAQIVLHERGARWLAVDDLI